MRFARSLLEFADLLPGSRHHLFVVGSIANHIPPPVWIVVGVSVVILFLFWVALAFLRGLMGLIFRDEAGGDFNAGGAG